MTQDEALRLLLDAIFEEVPLEVRENTTYLSMIEIKEDDE